MPEIHYSTSAYLQLFSVNLKMCMTANYLFCFLHVSCMQGTCDYNYGNDFAQKKPLIRGANKFNWIQQQWSTVLFIDESLPKNRFMITDYKDTYNSISGQQHPRTACKQKSGVSSFVLELLPLVAMISTYFHVWLVRYRDDILAHYVNTFYHITGYVS